MTYKIKKRFIYNIFKLPEGIDITINRMKRFHKFPFLILLIFLFFSCSTTKDRWINRTYHKVTSHYNAWYNGNESLKEGVAALAKAHQDNYMNILPVFKYGDEKNAQSVAAQMDRALTKASIVIKKHSMVVKKSERNRWIGESYMLIGKANFYKQNYMASKQTFEYIISHFKTDPLRYEAELWLARTFNQLHQFQKSQPQLDLVKNKIERSGKTIHLTDKLLSPFVKREIPISVYKELPQIYADYYVQQENYNPAVEQLKKAIKVNHKKKIRSRLTYILAQIYQKNGELGKAARYYTKVLKLNPPYEMAFNCKMSMAKCYDASNADSRSIKKTLLKMARDIKNKDYLDQIYFALAEIALKEKSTPEAIKYLKMSSASSKTNTNQKIITYLKIAELYFAHKNYINSSPYYDSTMTILPNNYPDYSAISDRKVVLSSLVKNLNTVKFEDSVQVLAGMPEKDRNAKIDKMVSDYLKKEESKKQAEINKKINQAYYGNNGFDYGNNDKSAAWYFYNPNSVKFGINDFIKKWGNRPLEDNWFLSNKKQVAFNNPDESKSKSKSDSTKADSSKAPSVVFNPKDRKSYLANIPLTPNKIKSSNERIEEALYNLGFIYKEGLNEYQLSAESFESLLKRFPETSHMLSSYYQQYKTYSEDLNNTTKSDYYKNLLLSKFPESDYAKMIQDPSYVQHIQGSKNAASVLYKETYQAYLDGDYSKVIENDNKALLSYKGNSLLPRFELLKALSIGKTSDIKAFTAALNEVKAKSTDAKVKLEAENILNYIANKDKKPENKADMIGKKGSTFTANDEAIHFYIMIVEAKDIDMNKLKIAISDFDKQQFSIETLNISSSFLNTDKQIVTVSNFDNKENALHYFKAIKDNKDVLSSLKTSKLQQFVISTDNYTLLFKSKDLPAYSKFFEENYLK